MMPRRLVNILDHTLPTDEQVRAGIREAENTAHCSYAQMVKAIYLAMQSTSPTEVGGLRVTQADRDAAARLVRQGCPGLSNGNKVIADEIKGGLHDDYYVVQTIAKHRLDAQSSSPVLVDRPEDVGLVEKVADALENRWLQLCRPENDEKPVWSELAQAVLSILTPYTVDGSK